MAFKMKLLVISACAAVAGFAGSAVAQAGKAAGVNVGIVVHEGVELLDFAGPAEAFGQADYRVFTVGPTKAAVRTQGGPVTVTPDYSIADVPRVDILVVPGGNTGVLLNDAAMMEWIKKTAVDSKLTMSVCTGAFTLAKAGLLDGKKATTYHGAIAGLRKQYPNVTVVEDVRWVDNGQIVTTAGVSAGIDGALHVVARLKGDEVAWQAARGMQYVWEPPLPKDSTSEAVESREAMKAWVYRDWEKASKAYGAIVAKHPEDLDAVYRLGMCQVNAGETEKGLANVEKAIKAGRADGRSLAAYGRTLLVVKRNPEAVSAYERALAAGIEDHGTSWYNLACGYALTGKKDEALKALGKAVDEGFSNRQLMETDEDLVSLRGEEAFKATVKRVSKEG